MRFRSLLAVLLAAALALAALAASATAAPRLTVTGAGFGHGVGLSQYGAQGWALQGERAQRIVGRYFTGTKVRSVRSRTLRVLLANGRIVSFRGASRAGRARLDPAVTYTARVAGRSIALAGGRRTLRIAPRARIAGSGPLELGGLGAYRGALELSDDGDGALQVVNAVNVEQYLRGVLPKEVYPSWRAEALKAQAIAARTYALANGKGGDGFDHYADTRSQAYGGVAAETATTDAAVAKTRGQVVTYRGRIVPVYFHASSGGRTENVEVGFPGAEPQPWLRGVADPYDRVQNPDYASWTRSFPLATAERLLRAADLLGDASPLREIRVTATGFSGRVVSAEVVGADGSVIATSGDALAATFALPSTWATYAISG